MSSKEIGNPAQPMQTIERHRFERQSSPPIHAGAMAMMGWRPGKRVSPTEYDAAIARFLKTAAGGDADA